MTAEVGTCNGVLEGCRVESEEVEVHAIPKLVLNEENLKLNEDKIDINCGGSESCVDDDEILPSSEQCEAELSNVSLDAGDHAPEIPVEDHELATRDEGHRPDCLLSENKEVDGESVENGETDCQFRVSVDDHHGIELHDSVNKPKTKLEVPCLVDGDDGVENHFVGNEVELPCLVNGDDKVEGDFVGNKLELPCLVNGDDKVEGDFVGNKLELPCLVNGEERIERDLVGDKLESPCLVNGEERIERDLVEDKLESPCLVNGEERVERDLVGDKLESPCFVNREDGAERTLMGNNELEQRSQLVAEVREINSPELVTGNDEKSEQCLSNGQNQASAAEFQCLVDENCEFESQSISMEEQKLELSPSVDVTCYLEETESMVSEENKLEENCESQSQNLENEDDACGHVIDEGKQPEPLFVLNADKGPALECVVEKSTELESHVVAENNEIEMGLSNGDSELEAQFDLNGDKNSGGYYDTVHPDMQEEVAVSAADWVTTGVLVGSNGLFTPVSRNEQMPEVDVPKKMLYCLVKIPRHLDNKIKAQIRLAQLQLDEKTQSRDFIRAAVQMKQASREQIKEKLKAARQEERELRDAIRSKRQEMEPVQLTLNRVKNATSVEEFDEKIYQMNYKMEHESIPLWEEKLLMRDIKQLKASRDQLCASAGPHSELQEAFNHIDKIQEHSKLLGQELDSLKKQAFQAEKNVQAIEKEFMALTSDSQQLQDQWHAAGDVRQEAYEALKALKKQDYERNNEFYQCKSDIWAAQKYAASGEREALDKLCSNQVERIMEIWNKNVEFRKEYVKDNERSILKRLETLDGRSLGPDEEPPLPSNYSDDLDPSLLPQGKPSASSIRSIAEAQPMTVAIAQQSKQVELKANRQQSSSNEVAVSQKKAAGKSKKSQPQSSRLIPEIESFEVSPVPSQVNEEDLAKKEEEAAKMKERIRQEEMRKAKEAEERKRKQAERANAKALARAQKEAERKEKKKANKKAAAAAANTARNDTTLSSDKVENGASRDFKSSPVEGKEATPEVQKLGTSQRKKPVSQKAKTKVVFPAAKKGRKGLQNWMWVLLAVCFCLAVMILWFYF